MADLEEIKVGDFFYFSFGPEKEGEKWGGGWVTGTHPQGVSVALNASIWSCEPNALAIAQGPWLIDHIAFTAGALSGVERLKGSAPAPELSQGHQRWLEGGARAVVSAPPAVILQAALGDE